MQIIAHEIIDDHTFVASVLPAQGREVAKVLTADPNSPDGRSNWVWVRLVDGTLILGVFPQGDTYIDISETVDI